MKKIIKITILLVVFSANSQVKFNPGKISKVPTNTSAIAKVLTTKKSTNFNPTVHGFKFANTFQGVDASRRYGGLCGGMVYVALDYFNANKTIPQQTYAPSNRYPLHSYIYRRQAKSAQESNWEKWAELGVNPGGIRNNEFFGWGIEMNRPGDRMNELKNMIDQGKPVPLGLFHSDESERYGYISGGDHQVLAIGYDFGRYKGDKGAFIEDFKIFVADPNFPGKTMTLVADANAKCFHYTDNDNKIAWLTYFVNTRYEPITPLTIQELSTKNTIYASFKTGHDDLRGGNDNVAVTVKYADGTKQFFPNVNIGATWVGNYTETVPLVLNREITSNSQITTFDLECSFGGGFGGDNWDLQEFKATTADQRNIIAITSTSFQRDGFNLVKRFSGGERTLTVKAP